MNVPAARGGGCGSAAGIGRNTWMLAVGISAHIVPLNVRATPGAELLRPVTVLRKPQRQRDISQRPPTTEEATNAGYGMPGCA